MASFLLSIKGNVKKVIFPTNFRMNLVIRLPGPCSKHYRTFYIRIVDYTVQKLFWFVSDGLTII